MKRSVLAVVIAAAWWCSCSIGHVRSEAGWESDGRGGNEHDVGVISTTSISDVGVGVIGESGGENVGLRFTLAIDVEDERSQWYAFQDPTTGQPYYHNTLTGATQWDHPFQLTGTTNFMDTDRIQIRHNTQGGVWRLSGTSIGSVLIYDRFKFRGILDHLPTIQQRHFVARQGPLEGTVASIEQVALCSLDEVQSRLEWSIAYVERQCDDGGCADLSKVEVQERYQTLASAWNDLGLAWFARGDWAVCLDCMRRSLWWNPRHTSTLTNLANVLRQLGRHDEVQQVEDFAHDPNAYLAGLDASIRPVEELLDTLPPEDTPGREYPADHAVIHVGEECVPAAGISPESPNASNSIDHRAAQQPTRRVRKKQQADETPAAQQQRQQQRQQLQSRRRTQQASQKEWEVITPHARRRAPLVGSGPAAAMAVSPGIGTWVWHPATQLCFVLLCFFVVRTWLPQPTPTAKRRR